MTEEEFIQQFIISYMAQSAFNLNQDPEIKKWSDKDWVSQFKNQIVDDAEYLAYKAWVGLKMHPCYHDNFVTKKDPW